MSLIRRAILAFALIAGFAPAMAQVPPPVPALPDSERRTSYSISGTTCACNVNFALYGDSTDFQNWVEVYLNGALVNFNDATFGWAITVPTGSLATRSRPISDAILTFTAAQTGTVQIVGARRPRRASQFSENAGVPARAFNQVLTDIIAQNREIWDKTNDFTGRGVFGVPGETMARLPPAASRANQNAIFDTFGNLTAGTPITGGGVISSAMQPVVSAATLAAGRTALGIDATTVPYTAPFTGAVSQTQSAENARTISIMDFGAAGNGSTDDTTALQNWINACQTSKAICYLDGGTFKTTATLNVTAGITILGASPKLASIVCSSTTLDCIAINTTAAVNFRDFGITAAASSANSAISLQGSGNGNVDSRFDNLTILGACSAYNITIAYKYAITRNYIGQVPASCYGLKIANTVNADFGDGTIANNWIYCGSVTTSCQAAIEWNSGGGLRVINNKINGEVSAQGFVIGVNVNPSIGVVTSDILINNNSIEGFGNITNTFGVQVSVCATCTVNHIQIGGNQIAGPQSGILWSITSGGGLNQLVMSNNNISLNGQTSFGYNFNAGVATFTIDGGTISGIAATVTDFSMGGTTSPTACTIGGVQTTGVTSHTYGSCTVSPSQQFGFNSATSIAQASTVFVGAQGQNAAAANVQAIASKSGIFRNLQVVSSAPASGQTETVALMVNGSASTLTCTITGPATSCSDTSHAVAIAAGQAYSLRNVTSATTGSITSFSAGVELASP